MTIALNRRHKAALFVTLVAAGTSLVSGDAVKMGLGTILLGVAFAWAFGSNSRGVHCLFLVCGLLIVIGSLSYDWHAHREQARLYRDQVAEFERRIPDFAASHAFRLPTTNPEDKKVHYQAGIPLPPNWIALQSPDGGWVPGAIDESPPAELRLTRNQLAQAIKKQQPAYRTFDSEKLVDQFLDMNPGWRSALVGSDASPDFQPKWYADAVAAGVNVTEVPDLEKPGAPPEPFKLGQSVGNEWILMVPGVFLFFVGVGLLFGVKPTRNHGQVRHDRGW